MNCLMELCEKPESGEDSFSFWYKLYADDLVLCVHYKHLEVLLVNLHRVSVDHDLLINPKKCAVFAVRNHAKISPDANLQGIPVATEYCYLGVTINDSGSIEPQLQRIQQRSKYLRANLGYYTQHLSLENQYLLW